MQLFDIILVATLNNQAERYKEEGRYADAEPLYKRVLAINEKALGPDHPSVGLALNDLAELYSARVATPMPSRSTSGCWRSGKKPSGRFTPMSCNR